MRTALIWMSALIATLIVWVPILFLGDYLESSKTLEPPDWLVQPIVVLIISTFLAAVWLIGRRFEKKDDGSEESGGEP